MSSQEQKDIAARTLLEHAEAKKRLAGLRAKATSYGNDLRTIASAIAPYTDERRAMNADEMAIAALERYPAKDQVVQLVKDVRQTEAEVETLSRSIREMGYPI